MAFTTYPNQKTVQIHKPAVHGDFLQIQNADWMAVNRELGPYGLQLYLYLAANADGFSLELSPQAAENASGITRTTFYKYLRLLEIHGYLVWHQANGYHFYTVPQPEHKRTHPDEHDAKVEFCVSSS